MSNPGPGSGDIFDVKKVRRLVEMMKEHDLAEIDLRQGDQRVRLRRGAEPMIGMPSTVAVPAVAAAGHHAPATEKPATGAAAPGVELATVKSPMVGTFYVGGQPGITAVCESRRSRRAGKHRLHYRGDEGV